MAFPNRRNEWRTGGRYGTQRGQRSEPVSRQADFDEGPDDEDPARLEWNPAYERSEDVRRRAYREDSSYGTGGYGMPTYGGRGFNASPGGGYTEIDPYGAREYGFPSHTQDWGALQNGRGGERGAFSGLGPKGYQRSDERIREDVCDALTEDEHVDATDVTVEVERGEVTLAGEVPDRGAKRRAELISERVRGVLDVHNRLRSRRGIIGSLVHDVTNMEENAAGKGPA